MKEFVDLTCYMAKVVTALIIVLLTFVLMYSLIYAGFKASVISDLTGLTYGKAYILAMAEPGATSPNQLIQYRDLYKAIE